MTAKFLHCEVREKGGAYGGGASVGGGLFSFYSYRWVGPPDTHTHTHGLKKDRPIKSTSKKRCLSSDRDPNSVQTLSVFGKSVDWAKSGQFTQQDVDEAKLSVFSAVDSPVAPADKGVLKAR